MSSIVLGNRPLPVVSASRGALYLAPAAAVQTFDAANLQFTATRLSTGEVVYKGIIKGLHRFGSGGAGGAGGYVLTPADPLPVPAGVVVNHGAGGWPEEVGVTISSYVAPCAGPYARCSTSMCW